MAKRCVLLLAWLSLMISSSSALAESRFLQSEFLQIGARAAAMGGGHVALPGGVAGAYYNPALLPWTNELEFVLEGSFISGPDYETGGGANSLSFDERGNFSMVGVRFPDLGDFSFAILEVTRYDHAIDGFLYGPLPGTEGDKPLPYKTGTTTEWWDSTLTINNYRDYVSIHSFGLTTAWRGGGSRGSFGFGIWVDRKKVFKEIHYLGAKPPTTEQVLDGTYDSEGTTNDVGIRFTGGFYYRFSDRLDGGFSFSTSCNLQSVLQVDEWTTNTVSTNDRIVDDETPVSLQGGLAYYVNRDFRWAGDISYYYWNGYEGNNSVVRIGTGVEWDVREDLVVRGGLSASYDPSDLESEEKYAEALRDIERSGNLLNADEHFVSIGAGYHMTPYMIIDVSLANSDFFSPEDGRTSACLAIRFVKEQPERD